MNARRVTVDQAALALAAAGAPPLTDWQREVLRRALTPAATGTLFPGYGKKAGTTNRFGVAA